LAERKKAIAPLAKKPGVAHAWILIVSTTGARGAAQAWRTVADVPSGITGENWERRQSLPLFYF